MMVEYDAFIIFAGSVGGPTAVAIVKDFFEGKLIIDEAELREQCDSCDELFKDMDDEWCLTDCPKKISPKEILKDE